MAESSSNCSLRNGSLCNCSLAILGSTGSIGCSTLDVVRLHRDRFQVRALTCSQNVEKLIEQANEFQPELLVVDDSSAAERLQRDYRGPARIEVGMDGLMAAASLSGVSTVVVAVVGFAGLRAVLEAFKHNKNVALANKESLVAGGALVMEALRGSSGKLVPIDSEHNTLFQCLLAPGSLENVRRVILTASGGPFLRTDPKELANVKAEDALKHPRWSMGKKNSIDSATMMNKGLELIEAAWLFGLAAEKIEILVHPQSIVHGLVEFHDSMTLAGLYEADMKVPIAFALGMLAEEERGDAKAEGLRSRISGGVSFLELVQKSPLEFYAVDDQRFPSVKLCYDVLRSGGCLPTVLNAANEVAVGAFLEGKIAFTDIYRLVFETLNDYSNVSATSLAVVTEADSWARQVASKRIGER